MKKDKEVGLKGNTQMHYKGLGRVEAKTKWSKNGKEKTIPQLQEHLIEIIKLTKNGQSQINLQPQRPSG